MNPNAIPSYDAFASSLTPDQRSYIQNYVLSAVSQLVTPLIQESMALNANNRALIDQVKALEARVNSYESKFRDDAKYSLTRAKIVSLMKELNIQ